ncbi:MAG: hypothetical protein JKY84_13065, partial [Emcibacteraceae bacterium]|nr:hypothetical protein [Emcibacteraceae bacterium]
MKINITEMSGDKSKLEGAVVVFSSKNDDGFELSPAAKEFDDNTGGALIKGANASKFKGKFGQMVEILAPSGIAANRVLLVGIGEKEKLNETQAEKLGGKIIVKLMDSGDKNITVISQMFA